VNDLPDSSESQSEPPDKAIGSQGNDGSAAVQTDSVGQQTGGKPVAANDNPPTGHQQVGADEVATPLKETATVKEVPLTSCPIPNPPRDDSADDGGSRRIPPGLRT
jgi:hypothetical protein